MASGKDLFDLSGKTALVTGTSPNKGLPTQRRPRHYGKAAVFLASDGAEMITGIGLQVDAGAVSRYWMLDPGADE